MSTLDKQWQSRDKTLRQYVTMLFNKALQCENNHAHPTRSKLSTLAKALEKEVYQRTILDPVKDMDTVSHVVECNTLRAYRNAARLLCRCFTENKALRDDVITHNITVQNVVQMRPRDLHPQATMWHDQAQREKEYDERKTKDEAERAHKLKRLQQESGEYSPRCPKCHTTNITFYQLQTRRSDEGMSTFYCCLERTCQLRWRR